MKEKAPAVQWYPKQYLGDDKVIAMDWDARGMHHWLLNISWQQDPPGSIPDNTDLIRRWLGSPSEDIWRRVRPQIFSAWLLRDGRWFNSGMVRAWERLQRYSESRSKSAKSRWGCETDTKTIRESCERHEEEDVNEVTVIPVRFKLEDFDGQAEFDRLCNSYLKAERSNIAQQRFHDAVEWCVRHKQISRKEACDYIIERARIYCAVCKFQKGLTKWLEEKIFEQNEQAWGESVVKKSTLDDLYGK